LDILEEAGIPVEAACGGFAACNTCRVRVLKGSLSPIEEAEEPFLDRPDQRLSCQAFMGKEDVVLMLEPGA
jgi:ferredoxin